MDHDTYPELIVVHLQPMDRLTAILLSMGPPFQLSGTHTGFPSLHNFQRPTTIACPSLLMTCHSHLALNLTL